MVESKFVLVTPQKAEAWLKTSLGNRSISSNTLSAYISDMKSGKWLQNGEAIRFDSDGHLRDGHHRLMAISKANVPLKMYVTTGLNPDECEIYDRGRPRSIRDTLSMIGVEKWQKSPAIVSLSRFWFRVIKGLNKPSDFDVYNFELRNSETLMFIYERMFIGSIGGQNTCLCKRAPISLALFCALNCGVDRQEISDIMKSLNSGLVNDKSQSSVIVLRNMVMSGSFKSATEATRISLMKATEMAIDAYVRREPWQKARHVFVPKYSNNKIIQEL